MARRAAVVAHQRQALILQPGVVHVIRVLVAFVVVLAGEQVAGDIARLVLGEAQARHGSHLLHLQFVAVVGTLAVLQVEHVGQALAPIVFGGEVLLFESAIGCGALPRIVYPAHQVIVVGLLAFAAQVGGESAALFGRIFSHGVAGHATAGLEGFLASRRVAGLLLRQLGLPAGLPKERRNR